MNARIWLATRSIKDVRRDFFFQAEDGIRDIRPDSDFPGIPDCRGELEPERRQPTADRPRLQHLPGAGTRGAGGGGKRDGKRRQQNTHSPPWVLHPRIETTLKHESRAPMA